VGFAIMLFIMLLTWYLIGVSSFYFWWTRELKITSAELPVLCITGICGPFAYILGYIIHAKHTNVNFFGIKK
jgi:hypothetical protein